MSSLNLPAKENAIVALCKKYLDTKVIWERQGEVRPPKPYASIDYLIAPTKIGEDDAKFNDSDEWEVTGSREITIVVNFWGQDAFDALPELQNANEYEVDRRTLALAGVVFVKAGQIRDLSQIEGPGYQTRGQMEIVFRLISVANDPDVGYIEKVSIENAVKDDLEPSTIVVDAT